MIIDVDQSNTLYFLPIAKLFIEIKLKYFVLLLIVLYKCIAF